PDFDEIPSAAFESDRPSGQAPTQKKLLVLPADLAMLINLRLGHARIDQLFTSHLSPLTAFGLPALPALPAFSALEALLGLAMQSRKFYHRLLKEVDGNPKRTPL
ncbi:MAG: hypothetical protein QOH31_6934, partial [Verrucomicrobiota bacterium]